MLTDAPKPISEFSKEIKINEKIYKIIISQNSKNLLIKSIPLNSLIPIEYEKEFTKNDLDKISKFFKMFDDINDLIPEITYRIEENKFKININENNFQIDFYLGIKNINDFTLILQKKKNLITVDYLYDLINNVINEINELKIDNKNIKNENQELKKEINELKIDNKNIKNENQELKKEINELKIDNKNIKNENQELKKEINELKKELKDKEIKKKNEEIEIFKDSNIINNKEEENLILNWIKPNTKMKFNLLYKVSRDGDRISTFTEKVSNKYPTLILIKTNDNYKFGGYTSQQWNMTGRYTYVKDELAFIFSLNKKKKYSIKNNNVSYAICGDPNHFAFGGGHDFCIWDQCTKNNNSQSYNGNSHTYNTTEYYELTEGKNNFYVYECEVYHVVFL